MHLAQAIRTYYTLFGVEGLVLGAKAKLLQQTVEALVAVPEVMHPVHLRLLTTDVFPLWHVLLMGEYDCELSIPPRLIVDAGANIGLASIFYANRYPDAKIIAIEPEPANYEILVKNAAPYKRIVPIRAALWHRDEELLLVDPGLGNQCFQTNRDAGSGVRVRGRVPGTTVDRVMEMFGFDCIDVLKVDIEGSEKEVFSNSSAWIDKVRVIAVETHDRFKEGCTQAVDLATRDFEGKWARHETVFLARTGSVVNRGQSAAAADRTRAHGMGFRGTALPLKILNAA